MLTYCTPCPLRDTLLSAATEGCFKPFWSEEILNEAIGNLIANGRMTTRSGDRLRAALADAFEDSSVDHYQHRIADMPNHPKDRHVAACGVEAGVEVIVTSNLRDFRELPGGIKAMSPDDFLVDLLVEFPDRMRAALSAQVARLRLKPLTIGQVLEGLKPVAPSFAAGFRAVHGDLC